MGGLTDWKERDVEVDLSFLGDGEFNAEIFRDGINADRVGKDVYKRQATYLSEYDQFRGCPWTGRNEVGRTGNRSSDI